MMGLFRKPESTKSAGLICDRLLSEHNIVADLRSFRLTHARDKSDGTWSWFMLTEFHQYVGSAVCASRLILYKNWEVYPIPDGWEIDPVTK